MNATKLTKTNDVFPAAPNGVKTYYCFKVTCYGKNDYVYIVANSLAQAEWTLRNVYGQCTVNEREWSIPCSEFTGPRPVGLGSHIALTGKSRKDHV